MSPAASATVRPPERPLIEPQRPAAIAGQGGYDYQRVASVDVDGDGEHERVYLIADARLVDGQPLWEDGHTWQVYVEEPTGERTHVFARFVQLGTVDAKITEREPGQPPHILLIEHAPDSLSVYEVAYHGPGAVQATALVERAIANYPQAWFTQPSPQP